jgi:hypothetical protein
MQIDKLTGRIAAAVLVTVFAILGSVGAKAQIQIPGTFEAEDFDSGGEGIGYHDKTSGNAGGQYRPYEDVDIIRTGDREGDYDVNNFQTGEWLAYTVNVAQTGNYDIELRLSSSYSNSRFHIRVNGKDVTGSVAVPRTGGWRNYRWVGVQNIRLNAGQNRLQIVVDQEYFNLNSIRATARQTAQPYWGMPIALPGTFQAEDFDHGGEGLAYHDKSGSNAGGMYRLDENVDIIATRDTTGYLDVNHFETGEWLNYTVDIAKTATYDLELRVASGFSDSAFRVELNGVNITGRVSVPHTGGWSSYEWLGARGVSLPAGQHSLRIVAEQQYFNLNAVRVTAAPISSPYTGTPIPLPGTLEAANFDLGGQGAAYHDQTPGNAGGQYRLNEDVDIIVSSNSSGGFDVNNFETGEWLNYTVDVANTADYDIELLVASGFTESAFRIEVNGLDLMGRVTVPYTGGWRSYQWVGAQRVGLKAGRQVLRIVADQQYFNLNSIRVVRSATAPILDPSTVEFSCSFANSPTDCGFREQAKVAGRATIVNVARDGNTAVRLNTQPGDTNVSGSGSAVRNDLMLSQTATGCYQGAEQWWAHSVLFPDDYVVPPDWGVAFDFHHTGSTGQANFHVDAASYGLRLRGYGGASVDGGRYEVMLGPVVRNKWYDFVYNVRWSSGTDGFLDAWVDGRHVLSHRGPTLYAGMGCYLKLANYHTATDQASSIIHDRVIRGTTPEAVSIGPLEGVLRLVNGVLTRM